MSKNPLTVYAHLTCGTCKKALAWLDAQSLGYEVHDIKTNPPSAKTLKAILQSGDYELKSLFNTSGMLYRSMNIKEKRETMSEAEALKLLAGEGMLVKRPIITDGKRYTVGFREARFEEAWGK